jgi:hypothetical protein
MDTGTQVQLKVRNEVVRFRSDGDPTHIAHVSGMVQSILDSVDQRLKGSALPTHHIVLLAMMELAEDYAAAKIKIAEHQSLTRAKVDEVSRLIHESGIGRDAT